MIFNKSTDRDNTEIQRESAALIGASILLEGLTPDELEAFVENSQSVNIALAEEIVTEKTIVKLDKVAKLNRAFTTAVYTVAREKKDKDFSKLVKLWKMERILEDKLTKKYKGEATRRAKVMVRKTASSKSKPVAKSAAKKK